MSTVNPYDPTPAYLQIADTVRQRIARGELHDGDRLPSVREMAADYGTALGTVRQAIDHLQAEGLVVTRQGKGTFVRQPRRLQRVGSVRHLRSRRTALTLPLESEAATQGFQRTSELVEVSSVAAPPVVAERLAVPENASVVLRTYLLMIDGEPAQTARSYFPHELADSTVLAQPVKPPGGTHAYLSDELGFSLDIATEELVARMPTPQESATLRLVPGTPVVELIRTIYDDNSKPLEVTIFVFAADRHSFVYVVPMD